MNKVKPGLYLSMILLSTLQVFSQSVLSASLNPVICLPQYQFQKNIKTNGYGLDGHIAYHIDEIPVAVGVSGSLLIYGREREYIADAWMDEDGYLNWEDSIYKVSTNSLLMAHLFARIQPDIGRMRPYIDGLIGFSWFRTYAHFYDYQWGESYRNTFQLDRAFCCGMGGGFQYCLVPSATFFFQDTPYQAAIYLNLGFRYLYSGFAKYLRREPDEVYKSYTDIFTVRAGLTFLYL